MVKDTMTYFVDCMASDKNAVILEFWDVKKGKWSKYEATRTAPGIAVTSRGNTVRFNENRLLESDREIVAGKAITEYNKTAERYEAERNARAKAKAPATATTAKAANMPAGKSGSSELDFAMELMNRFGLNDDDTISIMKLCKERYSSSSAPVNKLAEKMAAAGLE